MGILLPSPRQEARGQFFVPRSAWMDSISSNTMRCQQYQELLPRVLILIVGWCVIMELYGGDAIDVNIQMEAVFNGVQGGFICDKLRRMTPSV